MKRFLLVCTVSACLFLFAVPAFAQGSTTALPDVDVNFLLNLLQQFGAGLAVMIAPFLTSPLVAWVVQFFKNVKPEWDAARVTLVAGVIAFVVTLVLTVLGFKPQLDGIVGLFLLFVASRALPLHVTRTQLAFVAQLATAARAQAAAPVISAEKAVNPLTTTPVVTT